jgi:hypothetical protein
MDKPISLGPESDNELAYAEDCACARYCVTPSYLQVNLWGLWEVEFGSHGSALIF